MITLSTIKKTLPNLIEGVMVKDLFRHPDDRGYFEEIIRVTDPFFQEGFGQLSRSFMRQGVVKAWHVHKTQIDWWFVFRGTLQVALYDQRRESKTYKRLIYFEWDESEDVAIKIPPLIAHGLKVIKNEAILVYITSKTYNPKEEGRIDPKDKEIGFDWNNFAPIKK
ncbi:dTDP-4-dehydrorhamnose 3,5-epimerase family protein [Candidatus Gottesmanbacteria bacterium]|nr:dTDP-4-dehydrorhamnose 3,5-epimerase family protein [Candidatus Gottesmanbacteria bacterium]